MNLMEVWQNAKELCSQCYVCPVCNGIACKGKIPGMGGKQSGSTFIRNVEKIKDVKINLDVIYESKDIDTSSVLFETQISLPVYLAPIAGVRTNYGTNISDEEYTRYILEGCQKAKTIAFTGDGVDPTMFSGPATLIDKMGGHGICTMKPWIKEGVDLRLKELQNKKVLAVAMDIDSAGLPLLRNSVIPVENKSIKALQEMKAALNVPLIIKGIMTCEGALKALEAGADAIIVSNHGGRVLDDGLATIEVLEDIVAVVKGKMVVLVDGGFRTGSDVFKALALGADGVLIGRPLGLAAIGGKAEGVYVALEQIRDELKQTMIMTGCYKISDITRSKVTIIK